ncbi:hypothetical protein DPMN_077134 [Dreissena polymorpha]|uniref:Uncharacterized protein n=1 Tax=Dreissena polymorpha TaxID=45954 RepID=A0A9D3YMW4_DREPO|nr:hypothetical protein DPMN_077134 [Dreissena polymorpha]
MTCGNPYKAFKTIVVDFILFAEGHDNVHYNVIPDDIRECEATSYTSLQVC